MWQWVVSGAAAVSLSYSGTTTIEVLVGVLRCVEEEGKGKQAKLYSRKSKHCLECVKLLCVSRFDCLLG